MCNTPLHRVRAHLLARDAEDGTHRISWGIHAGKAAGTRIAEDTHADRLHLVIPCVRRRDLRMHRLGNMAKKSEPGFTKAVFVQRPSLCMSANAHQPLLACALANELHSLGCRLARPVIEGGDRGDLAGCHARCRLEEYHGVHAPGNSEHDLPLVRERLRDRLFNTSGLPRFPHIDFQREPLFREHGVETHGPLGTLWASLGLIAFYIALIWLNSLLGLFLTPLFIVPLTWLQDKVMSRRRAAREKSGA